MGIFDNGLPPGLRGYVVGQEQADRRNANQMQTGIGILNAQNMMEQQRQAALMHPLQLEALQQKIQQARDIDQLKRDLPGLLNGGGPASMAFGEGGISTPGGGQANMVTGQSMAPGAGNPRGILGVNPIAMRLMASDDPGLGKIGAAIQESSKPMNVTEGGAVYVPGVGPVYSRPKLGENVLPETDAAGNVIGVRPLPGMTGVVSGVKQAELGPQIVEREIGGRKVNITNADFNTLYGPDQLAAVKVAQKYSIPFNGGVVGDQPQASTVNTPPALQPQSSPVPGASGVGRIPTANVVGLPVNPTAAESASSTTLAKERAEGGVKYEQGILDAGVTARRNLTTLQLIAPDLNKMPTGPLYPTIVNLQNYMQQFGLKVDPTLGQAQATDALLKQMALKMRDPSSGGGMPGAMSDADREFLAKTIPGLASSPQGNRMLIRILSSLEQRKIDEASIVNKMQAAKFGSNEIRTALGQYAERNSLSAGLQ